MQKIAICVPPFPIIEESFIEEVVIKGIDTNCPRVLTLGLSDYNNRTRIAILQCDDVRDDV